MDLNEAKARYESKFNSKRVEEGKTSITLVQYTYSMKPAIFNCSEHGDFPIASYNRACLVDEPCPKCRRRKMSQVNSKYSDDEYIKMFTEKFGNKYTFDMKRNLLSQITVICPDHGSNLVYATRLLERKKACPKCLLKKPVGVI